MEKSLYAVFSEVEEDIWEQISHWIPYDKALDFMNDWQHRNTIPMSIFKREAHLPYVGEK